MAWENVEKYLMKIKLHKYQKLHTRKSESLSVVSNSLQPHGLCMEFSRPEYWSGRWIFTYWVIREACTIESISSILFFEVPLQEKYYRQ